MARTAFRRRPDGAYQIVRVGRTRVGLLAVAGLFVFLPLLLSLLVVLPPIILALPPLTLGLGVYVLLRTLDLPPARATNGSGEGPATPDKGQIIRLPVRRVRQS